MLKFFQKSLNILLHIPAIAAIYYFWQPISNWYFGKVPALGIDLYLSATYVNYQLRHFSLPFNSFKDIWWAGLPLARDNPQLVYYLMMPFAAIFGAPLGIGKFAMVSLIVMIVSCYFLFYKLSKNHGISLALSVLILLTPNMYRSATWAGSIPYFSSEVFFPLGLLAGALYIGKPTAKYLAAMIFICGVGILVHPLGILAFLAPSLLMIILIGGLYNSLSKGRITLHLFSLVIGLILASFTFSYDYVITLVTQQVLPAGIGVSTSFGGGSSASATENFYKTQIPVLLNHTNPWLFKLLIASFGVFVIGLIFSKKRKKALAILPFVLVLAYTAFHPWANLSGFIVLFRHDPYRAFWPFAIACGALAAACWGFFLSSIEERLSHKQFLLTFNLLFGLVVTGTFVIFAYSTFASDFNKSISVIDAESEFSSAYPEALSIKLKKDDLISLKSKVLPSFISADEKNRRLYDADATVNVWWNSFFDVPLVRGYVDPPIGLQNRGGYFLLDIGIANDSMTRDFKVSEKVAKNTTLFLIDWYGIGYFEGGRLGSKGPSPGPSSYLLQNNIFDRQEEITTHGAILKWQTASGKPELIPDLPQTLKFYKVADNSTSPILYPTNASAVIVFGTAAAYEDIWRMLASENVNSKKLIVVYGGYFVDDVSPQRLKDFDAVFLDEYHYHNKDKAFDALQKYVNEGGKVFMDTGAESKESNNDQLPELFPMKSSERKGLGKSWDLTKSNDDVVKEVDLSKFGPPIFSNDEWKLSFVPDDANLRQGSEVILRQKGKPILVRRSLGQGKVVWSGLNLAYHYNQYKSDDEAKLFINILGAFADISERQPLVAKTQWQAPERINIETQSKPRGILFKEQGWDGWSARLASQGNKKLPIYLAGPTFPGFMYVPIKTNTSTVKLNFSYNGTFVYWFAALVNILTWLLLLDLIILNGWVVKRLIFTKLGSKVVRKVLFWWEKEDEE